MMKSPLVAVLALAAIVGGSVPLVQAAELQPQAQRRQALGQRAVPQRPLLQNRVQQRRMQMRRGLPNRVGPQRGPMLGRQLGPQRGPMLNRRPGAVLRGLNLTEAQRDQLKALRGERAEALKKVLTEEQLKRLEQIRKRRGGR